MNSLRILRWDGFHDLSILSPRSNRTRSLNGNGSGSGSTKKRSTPANLTYPYLAIETEVTDDAEDIYEIRGSYKLSASSKITCNIAGNHLKGLVGRISTEGSTLNQKLSYKLKENLPSGRRHDNRKYRQMLADMKQQFMADISCYLVYLKLMQDPKIWSTDTFPFPFKLPIPEIGSNCVNYKVYLQVQCVAKMTVVIGENLPGTHWMRDIAKFWDHWGYMFDSSTDNNKDEDYTLLEAECEAIVGMAYYLKQTVENSIQASIHNLNDGGVRALDLASNRVSRSAQDLKQITSDNDTANVNTNNNSNDITSDSNNIGKNVSRQLDKLSKRVTELEIENQNLKEQIATIHNICKSLSSNNNIEFPGRTIRVSDTL
jgi:hypothetical protein